MKNWFIIAAVLVNINSLCCTAQCTYGNSPPTATIGRRLVLSCSLQCATETQYKWVNITGPNEVILPDATGSELVLSENVSSQVANHIFGQEFECQIECQGTTDCRRFKIGVMPRAYFNISSQVAKTGSGVNITCMSESYPPATDVDNYQMKHPNNTPITKVLIPEGNGVVHIISAASKGQDAGEYLCTVHVTLSFLEYPDILLQSDVVSTKLTLYDPPSIANVNNFTICGHGQTAILECAISNPQKNVMVWVMWSESDGKAVTTEHYEFQNDAVYYLLLYTTSSGNYMCQVFSTHSPDIPEDTQTASVVFAADSPTPSPEEVTPKQEKCSYTAYISAIVVLCVTIVVLMIFSIVLQFFKVNRCKLHVWPVHSTPDLSPPAESPRDDELQQRERDAVREHRTQSIIIGNDQSLAKANVNEGDTEGSDNDSAVFEEAHKATNDGSSLPRNISSRAMIRNLRDQVLRKLSSSSVGYQRVPPNIVQSDIAPGDEEQSHISQVDYKGMPTPIPISSISRHKRRSESLGSEPKSPEVNTESGLDKLRDSVYRRRSFATHSKIPVLSKLSYKQQRSVEPPLDSITESSKSTTTEKN